ncbi:cGMP-specific 3',5'-cyclic phosphodiesterase-like isoform X2 [Clavelina lepadiformis]|uniref:cGMP-specific 3',5'-cyclic phosphodiesterase-like isoform X2 n=1 Tax=Clavelina lepadiformis TaxID=159417 RepID=UPI0040430A6F
MTSGANSLTKDQIEAWLDDHPDFTSDYFLRKATQSMINAWIADRVIRIAADDSRLGGIDRPPSRNSLKNDGEIARPASASSETSGGRKTPIRKISHEEINARHLPLKPMVSTDELGAPSFYTPETMSPTVPRKSVTVSRAAEKLRRISHYHNPMVNKPPPTEEVAGSDSVIDERDMIMELVLDIAMDLDVTSVSHRILQNVSILLDADRCSLFLMREKEGEKFLVSRLFDVNKKSSLEETIVLKNEIRINLGQGIAGLVGLTGNTLNIPDAYQDSRFNQTVDQKTGYKTRSILCMPIKDSGKKIVGVAQVINKSVGAFTKKDEKIFASYLGFCGIAIHNAQLFEKIQLENRRNEVLLDLARALFEEQVSLNVVMDTILTHTTSLLSCERSSVMLVDPTQPEDGFKQTFEHVSDEVQTVNHLGNCLNAEDKKNRRKVPFNIEITSYVRKTGQSLNVSDVTKDKRFIFEEDAELGFKTKSLLCVPIRDSLRQVIGVIQLLNKNRRTGYGFTKSDVQMLEAFAIFCGLGISNARIYEKTAKLAAKQQVVLEVLSYHAIAPANDALHLLQSDIRSSKSYDLLRYQFDDSVLSDHDTMKAAIRMFIDLNMIEKFHIDYRCLCRWIASVKRNYRNVRYHNWRHAFNVCQSAFCMMKTGGLSPVFSATEKLALLVACLSHDLDHRGTNNAFQAKVEHPLARLYSTSTMEHHHYNQCLMLLQSDGCEILSQLSSAEYAHVIKLIQHAIISTDLAIYFQKRQEFFDIVDRQQQNWSDNEHHKELLRGMLMTGTDVSAITKPWQIEYKVAQQVAEEFFEQGDIEKDRLHQEPVDMMNRKLKHKLPNMQVGFIDSICLPLYKALTKVNKGLQPMLDGCLDNKRNWEDLAQNPNSGKNF